MGRKRLLTILAGVVAAVGLHMGPAVALDSSLSDASLDAVLDGVDPEIVEQCEDEDTVALIEKCIEKLEASVSDAGDEVETKTEDTTSSTTTKTKETVEKAEDTATSTTGGGGDTSSPTEESPTSSGDSSTSTSSSDTSSSSDSSNGVRAASGARGVERPDALSPEEARRFLAGSRDSLDLSGPRGNVTPAFDLSGSNGDLADPLVAAPGTAESDNEWQAASPETAPPRSDAELAAIPGQSPNEVPAGLKLIAGLLVAGTGTLWHLTRRELQPVKA